MRISDWSSDVCSADLLAVPALGGQPGIHTARWAGPQRDFLVAMRRVHEELGDSPDRRGFFCRNLSVAWPDGATASFEGRIEGRSEEHTSELQSLMRISYAVFCLKKKT